jgi:hypothetical protein
MENRNGARRMATIISAEYCKRAISVVANVIFCARVYANFYDRTGKASFTLRGGSVTLDATD